MIVLKGEFQTFERYYPFRIPGYEYNEKTKKWYYNKKWPEKIMEKEFYSNRIKQTGGFI
jgi:hypothetical protein